MGNDNWLNEFSEFRKVTAFNSSVILDNVGMVDLFNESLIADNWTGFFSKLKDWIHSCLYFPFDLTGSALTGQHYEKNGLLTLGTRKTNIACMNFLNTGGPEFSLPISSYLANGYFFMGQYHYVPTTDNFTEYNQYTSVLVYLPFCGYVKIDVNRIINKWIQFRLKIDWYTGQGIYYIGVTDNEITPIHAGLITGLEDKNTIILSQHTCQIGTPIAISETNASENVRNLAFSAVKMMGDVALTYGISGLISGGKSTSDALMVKKPWVTPTGKIIYPVKSEAAQNLMNKNPIYLHRKIMHAQLYGDPIKTDRTNYQSRYFKMRGYSSAIQNAGSALMGSQLSTTGDRTDNTSLMYNAPNHIKIIIQKCKMKPIDNNYKKLFGLPLGENRILGSLTGYTEITEVHIEGEDFENATIEELNELDSLLKSGIIL